MFTIEDICCLCLKNKKNLFNICLENNFRNEPHFGNLYEKLKLIIPEKFLEVIDSLSLICSDCYVFIDSVYEFREVSVRNFELFSKYVKQLKDDGKVSAVLSVNVPRCDTYLDPTDFLDMNIELGSETEFVEIKNVAPKRLCKKTYPCDVCNKQFSRRSNLNCHKSIHTGIKPFECEMCKKTFRTVSILNVHQRVHTGERPYGCDFCQKTYAHKESLRQHRKTHTGEGHHCRICGRGFSEYSQLRRHRETHKVECGKCLEVYFESDEHRCKTVSLIS